MSVLVSTAYLPPIALFKIFKRYGQILVEAHETYTKQTYRNRCEILTANGPLALTIPVVRPNGNHTLIKNIRIDNSVKWAREHWRAIESAYRSSAYFELVADYFTPYYTKEWKFLWDFNSSINNTIVDLLEVDVKFGETTKFEKSPENLMDYRNIFSPKKKDLISEEFEAKPYYQVFENKFGFTPNLSVLDLICNCGMESVLYL